MIQVMTCLCVVASRITHTTWTIAFDTRLFTYMQERLASAQKASLIAQTEMRDAMARLEREAKERLRVAEDKVTWLSQELERESFKSVAASPMVGDSERIIMDLKKRLERVERENDTLTEELDNCLGKLHGLVHASSSRQCQRE
jgi:hypothetical protein